MREIFLFNKQGQCRIVFILKHTDNKLISGFLLWFYSGKIDRILCTSNKMHLLFSKQTS